MSNPVADVPDGLAHWPKPRRRLLGQMLVDRGIIDKKQLDEILLRQRTERGSRVGHLLVETGYVTEAQICEVIADQLNIPAADLAAVEVAPEVLSRVPKDLCQKYVCLPWFVEGQDLYLIMADPTNLAAADAVGVASGLKVKRVVAPESEVAAALERFFSDEEASFAHFENIEVDIAGQLAVVSEAPTDTASEDDPAKATQSLPLVKLVNGILTDAIRGGASDVHIEPQLKAVILRYRVDGLLRQIMTMPKSVQHKVVSRIKVMSHMDVSERRRPQDGRGFIHLEGRQYDMRVSTLPTADGENVVIRILRPERAKVSLEELGFEPIGVAAVKDLLKRPQGMILVTGPAGSGKTSTLYASLNLLRSEATNIVTVEDPVEYRLEGVNQVSVSDRAGLTFAAGLRSILRQDPDVVMVGEIRDLETAQVAFEASQTGRLVLSTLHTNDAPSAVTRLVEMGIPAYVVASSLVAVLAQRLVRRLCECKTQNPDGTASAKGCEICRFTGFKGRMAVSELMRLTPRVKSVLLAGASDDVVRRAAQASGMRTMFADGALKCARGLTVLEEVARVVPPDDAEDGSHTPLPLPDSLSAEATVLRPSRILVVDDDQALRELLEETLRSEGYDVTTAANGQEALASVHRDHPDLVLTDLQMPVLDGLELLKRLRKDLSTCQIPVVFLTVLESLDSETRALDLGADDYVAKPAPRGKLLSRVRRALYRGQLMKGGR
jgi:type IV pilus assembly protein PilB